MIARSRSPFSQQIDPSGWIAIKCEKWRCEPGSGSSFATSSLRSSAATASSGIPASSPRQRFASAGSSTCSANSAVFSNVQRIRARS